VASTSQRSIPGWTSATCIENRPEPRELGWALRQYAWIDGDEIKKYVRLNRTRLKALSCREALKNLY
jgi:hypothetical protein